MKITFTHLDNQKTPKTSDSLKPTPNKSHKSQEIKQISAVVTARPRLGGQEKIVETTCENSYIHFNLQFVAKADASSVSQYLS